MTWIATAFMAAAALSSLPVADESRMLTLARLARAQQARPHMSAPPRPAQPPAPMPLRQPEPKATTEGPFERSKFDRVHAAAVAARKALFLNTRSAVAQQAFLVFATEATLAAERAETPPEKRLAGLYGVASGWTEHAAAMMPKSLTAAEARAHLETALKAIDAANVRYLGR